MYGSQKPETILKDGVSGHGIMCYHLYRDSCIWISDNWRRRHIRYFIVVRSRCCCINSCHIDSSEDLYNIPNTALLWKVRFKLCVMDWAKSLPQDFTKLCLYKGFPQMTGGEDSLRIRQQKHNFSWEFARPFENRDGILDIWAGNSSGT